MEALDVGILRATSQGFPKPRDATNLQGDEVNYEKWNAKAQNTIFRGLCKDVFNQVSVDVSPPIACHGGTRGSMFGLRRMLNSMVNARDSRFILVQALDRRSSNNLTSSRP